MRMGRRARFGAKIALEIPECRYGIFGVIAIKGSKYEV